MFRAIRLGGFSAILAGALRALASFVPGTTPRVNVLYFVIDVLLLVGLAALYGFLHARIGLTGRIGLALAMIAAGALIVKDVGILSPQAYPAAALAFTLGLDIFAISSLRAGDLPRWILVLWLASSVLGPLGYFTPKLSVLFVISGLMFGIGFAGAGVEMWRARRPVRLS